MEFVRRRPLPARMQSRLYHDLSYTFLVAGFLLIAIIQKRALRLEPSLLSEGARLSSESEEVR